MCFSLLSSVTQSRHYLRVQNGLSLCFFKCSFTCHPLKLPCAHAPKTSQSRSSVHLAVGIDVLSDRDGGHSWRDRAMFLSCNFVHGICLAVLRIRFVHNFLLKSSLKPIFFDSITTTSTATTYPPPLFFFFSFLNHKKHDTATYVKAYNHSVTICC